MKKLLVILAFLASALALSAQTTVKVQAPNLVALDEQFNVTFIISGENAPSSFEWSTPDEFQLVWGPQKGTSTSLTIVNGQRTKSSQTTYTYVLLPKKTGQVQLPPAVAVVKGERIVSAAHSVEVVANGASAGTGQGSTRRETDEAADSRTTGTVSGEDIFLRLILSKSQAVVGETVSATLKLYQRVNIAGFEDAKFPTFNGFWSQEVLAPSNIEFKRENVGDMIYNSAILRSWTLIPQQAGDIRIDPAELVCLVNVRSPRSGSGSIFDSFFQDDYQTIRKRVVSQAYTVHVKPLPAGAPASFGGGVGSFRMSTSISRDSLRMHDAASVTVTISGKGNVALLEAPKVDFPPDFEVYDVKVTENATSKTFEYPFIPRSYGDFVVGPVEYSYYDVNSGHYVTLRGEEMPVSVERLSGGTVTEPGGSLLPVSDRKDVRSLGSDIRYIRTGNPGLRTAGTHFAASAPFWFISVLLILASSVLYFLLRRAAARRADVAGNRKRGATKMARRRLARAGEFLESDLHTAFYEELHRALLGYVSDKLGMDASEMSRENIAARFAERNVAETAVSDFMGLLDACEFARYSPDSGHEAMSVHYEKAVSVISMIDDGMKRTGKPSVAALVAVLFVLAPGLSALASVPAADSLWNAGVRAYEAGAWELAAENWTSVMDLGVSSADLYYNIGNANFRNGDVAGAILGYERALRLNPSHKDAAFNLEYAESMIQDRIESVPEFFLRTWLGKVGRLMSPDGWAVLFLILLAVTLASALLFLLGSASRTRKAGFYSGLAAFAVALVCLAFSLSMHSKAVSEDAAIVTAAVSQVSSSPSGDSAVALFVLHEGTRVRVIDKVGEWVDVELADGRQGWMPVRDITII